MSIKRPTSGGQARTQEAAVQQIFHLERSSFFSTNGRDSTQRFLACTMHIDALNTDPNSCPSEVKPRPMKTIYTSPWHVEIVMLPYMEILYPLKSHSWGEEMGGWVWVFGW